MIRIAVDTLGGDAGSAPIVEGILDFLKVNKDVEIFAVGKKEELTMEMIPLTLALMNF